MGVSLVAPRGNLIFHNGKTMTADDVLVSMSHHRGQESTSAGKSLLKPVNKHYKEQWIQKQCI